VIPGEIADEDRKIRRKEYERKRDSHQFFAGMRATAADKLAAKTNAIKKCCYLGNNTKKVTIFAGFMAHREGQDVWQCA